MPSVIVPRETNYLINPAHFSFKAMVDEAREMPFAPDKRL
ncbi:RES family NAD+ phosphorylase [Halomonas sp. H33-56]